MTGFAEDLSVSDLERGAMDPLGLSLYQIWKEHRGSLGIPSSELLLLSPHIILTAGEAEEGDSPEILRVGNQTLFSKLCPEAIDTEHVKPKSLIDRNFRNTAHVGYHQAINDGLSYQVLSERCYPRGIPTDILFERAIVRWKLRSGLIQPTTYVKQLEIRRQTSLTNPLHGNGYLLPSQDHHRLSQDHFPSAAQPDGLWKSHRPGDIA